MGRMFGTDGVRGIANKELTCELALKIGAAGAYVIASDVHRPRILIGSDTRRSADMLCSALIAGICSVGGDAISAEQSICIFCPPLQCRRHRKVSTI